MEYLVSHKVLAEDPDKFAAEPYFFLWKRRNNWPYLALKTGDVLYWYKTPSKCLVWKSEVLKVATFEYQNKSGLLQILRSQFGSFDESHAYWKDSPESGYCLAFKVRPLEQINIPKPPNLNFSPSGWMKISDLITKHWVSDSDSGKENGTGYFSSSFLGLPRCRIVDSKPSGGKRCQEAFRGAWRADAFTFPFHNTDRWTSRSGKSRVTQGFLLGIEAQEQR